MNIIVVDEILSSEKENVAISGVAEAIFFTNIRSSADE